MHEDHLRMLFKEYKNCLKHEFSDYFGKDDEYKSYMDKCYNQWQDIKKYYSFHYTKIYYALPSREELEVHNRVGRRYNQFASYGWSENQVRN